RANTSPVPPSSHARSTRTSPWGGSRHRLANAGKGLLGFITFACGAAAAPPAAAVQMQWFNGVIANAGTDIACLSDPPIVEIRAQGYAGFSVYPGPSSPAVGELFYTHVVVSHPGNPCGGGSVVHLALRLPEGVHYAISTANPVFCFQRTRPNPFPNGPAQLYFISNCPQQPQGGSDGDGFDPVGPNGVVPWEMVQGQWIEVMVPLVADRVFQGNASIEWVINPDIAVYGYPRQVLLVNDDVVFRYDFDGGLHLPIDLCELANTLGCQ
ncbi:MAG TPA: hypothetical protein VFN09_11440, partial [Rhodanobacteraceae bacterium]|nr:hypothetical protein [Rhodanobacteraceae bacterium]